MALKAGVGAILSAAMLVPMLGCLNQDRIVLQPPATRMIAIGGGLCLFDDMTSRELDARLNASERGRLRTTLATQGGTAVPIYEKEVLAVAVECLVENKVDLVVLVPGPKEADEASAKDVEQRLKGKGLSVLILPQEWKAQTTQECTEKKARVP